MIKTLTFIFVLCFAIAGCGGSLSNNGNSNAQATAENSNAGPRKNLRVGMPIEITLKGKVNELDPKSAFYFSEDITINTADGKAIKTAEREIVIANYQMDASGGRSSVMKKLTSPEQMRLIIKLVDGPDAKKERPTTAAEYSLKLNSPLSLLSIQIFTFADGKEIESTILPGAAESKGSVRVSSTSSEIVSGEIDASNAEAAIFGSYIATVGKPTAK